MVRENDLKKQILSRLYEVIHSLAIDPDFSFEIRPIQTKRAYVDQLNRYCKVFRIKIETNNRPLLLGQSFNLSETSSRGPHSFYYYGYLAGYLKGKYGDALKSRFGVILDVHQKPSRRQPTPWRYIELQEAIDKSILNERSQLAVMMRKYDLKFLLITGPTISGPSLTMIKALEGILCKHEVHTVLDMFSGTGSLSKICLDWGALSATCVDVNTQVLKKTLKPYVDKYEIAEANAFDYLPDKSYDLALLDPPYDSILDVANEVVKKVKAKIIIFHVGPKYDAYCISHVSSALKQLFKKCDLKEYGSSIVFRGFNQ